MTPTSCHVSEVTSAANAAHDRIKNVLSGKPEVTWADLESVLGLSEDQSNKLLSLIRGESDGGTIDKLDTTKIGDSVDATTGLKVFSLYGETRMPTLQMLANVDTIVFDIQDIGTRFYTYISTMGNAMRAAARHGKAFVVLDRPNPIGGVIVSGPVLDPGSEYFIGYTQSRFGME